ncbi:MAG TPA: hypothetical protein VJS43_09200 [Candidatus Acidoferrales bacterium]|nr:hypothetical protein [Candidatus Acidoferrales bacterium]
MMPRSAKAFHALVGFALLICMACPDIEILCHSTDCIFLSGHDLETSVALLLVIIELTIVSLKLAVALLPRLLARLISFEPLRIAFSGTPVLAVAPTASPPFELRI